MTYCVVVSCDLCNRAIMDLHNVTLKKVGVACCKYCSVDGECHILDYDWNIMGEVSQFIYDEDESGDDWKRRSV